MRRYTTRLRLTGIAIVATFGILLFGAEVKNRRVGSGHSTQATGQPQLISVEPISSAANGEMCEWQPASTQELLRASLQSQGTLSPVRNAAAKSDPPEGDVRKVANSINRKPLREIRDPYPIYSAVAVDPIRNEIALQDENLFHIMIYDRMADTPPTATMTEPKRVIGGERTKVEFNCGLYIDPKSGDVYSVNNDTINRMTVFSREAKGNVPPTRELVTPHRTFGITVDEDAEELFLTVQHPPAIVVYHKYAKDKESPIRVIEGTNTRLEDPHGIALDTKNQLIYVTNQGSVSYMKDGKNLTARKDANGGYILPNEGESRAQMIPGSGTYKEPTITVYPLKGDGDVAPIRVIEGPAAKLNWPAQISLDEEHGELYVANDVGDSILVFRATDSGNAAPIRTIKGPKTGIKNPTGVFYDAKNQLISVASMGNHSATIYPRTADGDVAPLRTIRSAPLGKVALDIGNPGAVGYDTKRDQILVPN